jgi:hypothetical protein
MNAATAALIAYTARTLANLRRDLADAASEVHRELVDYRQRPGAK